MKELREKIMKKIKSLIKEKNYISYIILFFVVLIIYCSVYALRFENNISAIEDFMKISCVLVLIIGGYLVSQEGINSKKTIKCIMLLGFIMRIGYMLYTPCNVRSHDLWDFNTDSGGHAGYILNILEGNLPQNNLLQYYHPPFYYIVSAATIRIINIFINLETKELMIDGAKVVSCFASCGVLFITSDICNELKFKRIPQVIAVTFIAFLPNFYLLAGRVNNDSLSIFFICLGILYTIRWYKNTNYKNTMILAIIFGLGIMTKISVGTLAVVTGIVMLIRIYKEIRDGRLKNIIKILGTFIGISFPLALWYPIRNYILFNQPLSYVLDIQAKDTSMYCGKYDFFERFINFPINKLLEPLYNNPTKDHNTLIYLLKGGLFGEFEFSRQDIVPSMLIIVFLLLNVMFIMSLIMFIISKKEERFYKLMLTGLLGTFYIMYIIFNIKYPYSCTMDYRYIVPVSIVQALILGKASECMNKDNIIKAYNIIIGTLLSVFGVLSIIMFCSI